MVMVYNYVSQKYLQTLFESLHIICLSNAFQIKDVCKIFSLGQIQIKVKSLNKSPSVSDLSFQTLLVCCIMLLYGAIQRTILICCSIQPFFLDLLLIQFLFYVNHSIFIFT